MDFAKSHLEKHGWTEGRGLGRSEDGMKEAIKVKMKFDSCGIGHKVGDEFSFHWWDHMFNKALDNIDVENNKDGVKVNKNGDFSITSKKPLNKSFANKELLYGNFVKASTLTQSYKNGLMKEVKSSDGSDSSSDECEADGGMSFNNLTDDDLMRICGGRTAHKAARHGLKLNGKLKRIEEQETVLSRGNSDIDSSSADDQTSKQKKKNKKKKHKKEKADSTPVEVNKSIDNDDSISKELTESKKKKKSKKNKADKIEKEECQSVSEEGGTGQSRKRKREKKEKNCESDTDEPIPVKCKVVADVDDADSDSTPSALVHQNFVDDCSELSVAKKHKKSKKSKKSKRT